MSLFSVFDPSSYFGIQLNWVILFVVLMFFPVKYYLISSEFILINNGFYNSMGVLFKDIGSSNYLGMSFVCVVMFLYLIIMNLLGLFPFIFTSTAHPVVTMGLGLVLWLSFFLMGWLSNFKMSLAHLVPQGSPLSLAPLMVLIESISHLIRPFTLSVRLAANMMAGHLIVGLLNGISLISVYAGFLSVFIQSILLMLEFGVAIIQGFVFSILLLLYALDYY